MRKLDYPWHPYLFGLFPIFFLYARNADHVSWRQVIVPAVVTLAAIAGLSLLVNLIVRNLHKTALALSVLVIWFFSWQHLAEAVPEWSSGILYLASGLAVALIVWVLVAGRPLHRVTIISNQVGLVLIIIQAGLGGWALLNRTPLARANLPPIETASIEGRPPNIYYIVPDGYARADVLARLYGHDNFQFLSHLREVGFYIADSSHANYSQTQLSLTSALNMELIGELGSFDARSRDRLGFKQLYDDNRLFRFLKTHDYSIVSFYTPFDLSRLASPDYEIKTWYDLPEFAQALIRTTPLDPLLSRVAGYRMARERILFTLDRLSDLGEVEEPYFVLAHMVCPHPPFLWDAHGREVQPDRPFSMDDGSHFGLRGGTQREYVEGYRDQVRAFNRMLQSTIDRILAAHKDHPPVIIIQGDHGPGSRFHQISLQHTDIDERFPILNAYYLPDVDSAGLYPSISPVNSFRVVLNAYFGTQLPLVADRSFYSPSYYLLQLTEVTDRLAGR